MRQVVRDVREEGAPGGELFYQAQGILYRRVRGVRLMPQRVQEKDVQSTKLRFARSRDVAEVSKVRRVAETKAMDLVIAMHHADRLDARAEKFERLSDIQQLDLRFARILVGFVEDVSEGIAQRPRGVRVGVKRQPSRMAKAERPQIIEAEDMVGVSVRV